MKKLKTAFTLALVATFLIAVLLLSSCGGKGEVALIRIMDEGIPTEVEAELPRTVKKLLVDGQIELGENDIVTPALGDKIQEGEIITVEREHRVKLTVDGKKKKEKIVGGTVADLLKQEDVELEKDQMTNIPQNTALANDMEIEVLDKFKVSITVDGKTEEKQVGSTTVKDAIDELGISMGEEDRVTPDLSAPISNKMEITIKRVKTEEVTEKESIAFETSREETGGYEKGTEVISREGKPGEKTVTYKVTTVDGKEESREVISETIVRKPVTAIILVGTYEAQVYEEPYYEEYGEYNEYGEYIGGENEGASEDSSQGASEEVYEVSREDFPNCSGDGHGYYHIIYSDGTEVDIEY